MFDVRDHQEQNCLVLFFFFCLVLLNKETNIIITLKNIEDLFISSIKSHLGEYFGAFLLYKRCNIIIIRDISMTFRSLKYEI